MSFQHSPYFDGKLVPVGSPSPGKPSGSDPRHHHMPHASPPREITWFRCEQRNEVCQRT